ncbi:hypothetical protein M378DRAFT_10853 [Amanita muscaria Koide BX008]|uniref:NACHT domain-containing protein n=1 Tax=Amanita muscaria (strain Koide BX008) TaxID=946122 RepID=A0A0C2TF79_AMAMK|nr:hypothetical protein M378DRAFT_10853 [Amanita muscaria Koide BX008]
MLRRIFKDKGKKKNKNSSTLVPTTACTDLVPGLGGAVNDAHERVNLPMVKDSAHDQEQFESTSLGRLPAAEENLHGAGFMNTSKAGLKLTLNMMEGLFADSDARAGSLSTMDKGDSAKNAYGQGIASRDEDQIAAGVATGPVQAAYNNAQMFQNATNVKIENSTFYSAGGDLHVTNNFSDALLTRIPYADGAGIDSTKACLEGTRIEILDEIKGWVTTTDANTPQVLWLSGPAGTGKSAIAHSVARWWMEENGGIGSCFCFNRQATTRHERLFPTIALDLAARIPSLKDSLNKLTTSQPALATTADVTQQWRKFLQEPLTNVPGGIAEPVVIVIDALDESGGPLSRSYILSILASDAPKLPSNFRILFTSRPLLDIGEVFHNASGVRLESMDKLSQSSTTHDIEFYSSWRLKGVEGFGNLDFSQLAGKSDGLFEWARLACEYIKYAQGLLTKRERFEELMHAEEGKELLDTMYMIILRSILGDRPRDSTISRFRSVLRIVLSTLEPLPMDSLNLLHSAAVRQSQDRARYNVGAILHPLASLLSGVSDQSMPIRPLHSTFHEFLTTRARSGPFFVDVEDVNRDLAHACLQVMQQHLCFNICKLESSYVRNSEIADLGERIKGCIKPYLAYSCRFWTEHVKVIPLEVELAEGIKGILLNEKMLFWLEVLALLKLMGMVPSMLSIVASWLQKKDYEEVSAAARDGIRFARVIGGVISESTPHLYVSGLAFLPKNSMLSRHVKAKFPKIPRIVFGGAIDWPSLQLSIRGHTDSVTSIVFSPDGKRIASGSEDKTICIWDAETGLQVGNPLQGHADKVTSVAFSPDGKRIASGSLDKTIRIWDAETGLQRGNPLKGHTGFVTSVAFSPDGIRIASGSQDKTISIWDAEAGLQMGNPLKGHTHWVRAVAFSPDGKRIASGSYGNTVYIWNTQTGLQVGNPLKGHTRGVSSVAFSPDGKRIASGSDDETIYIWDAETGLQVGNPLKGHTRWVRSVAFSPDGKIIASGSYDQTIYIWDAESGLQVGNPVKGHTREDCIGFS